MTILSRRLKSARKPRFASMGKYFLSRNRIACEATSPVTILGLHRRIRQRNALHRAWSISRGRCCGCVSPFPCFQSSTCKAVLPLRRYPCWIGREPHRSFFSLAALFECLKADVLVISKAANPMLSLCDWMRAILCGTTMWTYILFVYFQPNA